MCLIGWAQTGLRRQGRGAFLLTAFGARYALFVGAPAQCVNPLRRNARRARNARARRIPASPISGAAISNRLPAAVSAGAPNAKPHPPPEGASAEGIAVTTPTMTAGVCVGGSGAAAGAGAAVGASV